MRWLIVVAFFPPLSPVASPSKGGRVEGRGRGLVRDGAAHLLRRLPKYDAPLQRGESSTALPTTAASGGRANRARGIYVLTYSVLRAGAVSPFALPPSILCLQLGIEDRLQWKTHSMIFAMPDKVRPRAAAVRPVTVLS